jgi:uncharacterized protein (DUF1697 family)
MQDGIPGLDLMTRYVAFLRGVNVGGHTMVKTSDICQRLASRGFANVKGYKQSGNIIFDTGDKDADRIAGEIQQVVHGLIGKNVEVFLRTLGHIREMVRLDPFGDVKPGDIKLFVTFYSMEPLPDLVLPLKSPDDDAEIILVRGREAFGLGYLKDGRYGASYGKIESKPGSPTTTRNWNTIKGIAALPDPEAHR